MIFIYLLLHYNATVEGKLKQHTLTTYIGHTTNLICLELYLTSLNIHHRQGTGNFETSFSASLLYKNSNRPDEKKPLEFSPIGNLEALERLCKRRFCIISFHMFCFCVYMN